MAKTKVFKKPKKLKMSKRSEKALDKSIEHWYRVRDENEIADSSHCELCEIYCNKLKTRCGYCPVYLKTGHLVCWNTPYYKYDCMYQNVSEPQRKRLAQAEIEFLQSCYY